MAGLLSQQERRGRGRVTPGSAGLLTAVRRGRGLLSDIGDWAEENPLDAAALATSPIPILGDVVGGVADAKALYDDPSWTNAGLAAIGLLPFVPGGLGSIRAYHGSHVPFDQFDEDLIGTTTDSGRLGKGFYAASDPRVAETKPYRIDIDLTLDNPLKVTLPDFKTDKGILVRKALGMKESATAEEVRKALMEEGFDGVEIDYSPTGYDQKEFMFLKADQARITNKTKQ